ncbi:MAG: hypothetical protein ACOVOI_19540 [Hyphomicrobiales bacterium]
MAAQLDPACHLRVHRSAIVRIDCISLSRLSRTTAVNDA